MQQYKIIVILVEIDSNTNFVKGAVLLLWKLADRIM